AEWEYACRAGTTSRYSFGEAITIRDANYDDSGLGRTSEVGAYRANPWGIYDMHGNVWEWVEDDWHVNYRGAPIDGSAWDPAWDPARPRLRLYLLRGGSWYVEATSCRSATRLAGGMVGALWGVGFRVARTLS